ncbi:MAG: MBOAT family O-acyltransferase [Oscillospiraceae bacterium]|nr:MBOAT family O-acyltransferase [Oscillospiraceae bacterium]
MSFTSLSFYLFFAAACALYFCVPARLRRYALLAADAAFYCFLGARFALTLCAVILLSWLCGLWIGAARQKKAALAVSLCAVFAALVCLKYLRFAAGLFGAGDLFASLAAPLGLSFYTLTCAGYLIDVYRGDRAPERDFVRYALFVGLFLQILSGPIPRSKALLPQFDEPKSFDFGRFRSGALRAGFGLFVKLVVADNLNAAVNSIYAVYADADGLRLITATVLYGFAIYCDFRAYTDIVLGCGEILGFTLPENFRAPYLSRSVREFWRRWHMSLSTWFRDYLYFPLGGSRCTKARAWFNTLVVFAASGLWHGASLNFLVWGLLHGCYLVCGDMTAGLRGRARKTLRIKDNGFYDKFILPLFVFLLVDFAWIFFRAPGLGAAVTILHRFRLLPEAAVLRYLLSTMGITGARMAAALAGLAVVFGVDVLTRREIPVREKYFALPAAARWAGYYAMALTALFLGAFTGSSFIYYGF